MPTSAATGAGDGGVVAGEQDGRQAEVAQLPRPPRPTGRLDRVGDDEHAARRAVPADGDRRAARRLGRRRRRRSSSAGSGSDQLGAAAAARPTRTACPSTTPGDAEAVEVGEVRRPAGSVAGRSAAPRAIAGAIGCSEACLERAGQPQHLVRVLAVGRRRRRRSVIRPVVTVPVLSSTTVSTRRVDSSTSGPLIRMPSWAPRPVPTISAVGVARPSAHGQAMISTATAAVNAAVEPGAGAEPEAEGARRRARCTIGHEDAGDPVGQPLHLGLAVLRLLDQPGHLGELGVGADPGGPHDQPAAGVDGRADDRVAGGRPRPAPTRR